MRYLICLATVVLACLSPALRAQDVKDAKQVVKMDEETKKATAKALEYLVSSQNPQGGWRYEPTPTGADISVTIMQVMALRSAKNAGLHVPDTTLKKAIAYIHACQSKASGGFAYQPGGPPGFARTAAGVCV